MKTAWPHGAGLSQGSGAHSTPLARSKTGDRSAIKRRQL